jgi:hypothetical protein
MEEKTKIIVLKTQADWNNISDQIFDSNTLLKIEGSIELVFKDSSAPYIESRDSSAPRIVSRDSSAPRIVSLDSSAPHIVSWDSSGVLFRGCAEVNLEIHDHVSLHLENESATVLIFGFAVAFLFGKAKALKKSKTATVIKIPVIKLTVDSWLSKHSIQSEKKTVILFKRVSKDFKTQEGTQNETLWAIASEVEVKSWKPDMEECGAGKFHACGRPYFCDEFRNNPGDRYIAISILVADLYVWPTPQYPHKIAFRKGRVLYECDLMGKEIKK